MLLCCINYNKIHLFSLVNELLAIIDKCYVQNRVAADPLSSDTKKRESEMKRLMLIKAEDY